MPINVLIVDDEAIARDRLRRLATREDDLVVVGECGSAEEALARLAGGDVDLVFLDVSMPVTDGFGLLQALGRDRPPVVIFVTAFGEHALKAFDASATDYLLKPVSAARFRAACAKARTLLAAREAGRLDERVLGLLEQLAGRPGAAAAPAAPRPMTRFMVRAEGRMYFVRTADIEWIEAAGNYVKLHAGKDVHVVRGTLASLEAQLDPEKFLRIHRSTIVNLECVRELQPWFAGDYVVLLRDGTRLKLSRWYRDRLDGLALRTSSSGRASSVTA